MNKSALIILCAIGAFALSNYLATVAVLSLSLAQAGEPMLQGAVFIRNTNPWSEWSGGFAYAAVPVLIPLAYLLLQRKLSLRSSILLLTAATFGFLAIADCTIAGLLRAHLSGSEVTSQLLYRLVRSVIFAGGGAWLAAALSQRLESKLTTHVATNVRKRAFTLIELLCVVAIISIVAALTMSVVARSKVSAKEATDVSNMHQLQMALMLYEEDQGDVPPLLPNVFGYVKSPQCFCSPSDPIPNGSRRDYLADIFAPKITDRSSFRISYTYLRAWSHEYLRWPAWTWSVLSGEPTNGLLATTFYKPLAPIQFPLRESDLARTNGFVFRIQMDGALKRHFANGDGVGGSMNDLFLDP